MRTLLLASTLVVLAACSDNQQPTAPRSASSRGSAAGDVAPVGQGIKLPDAKPADQVGFTNVTKVITTGVPINPGSQQVVTAHCPTGTVVIGGSYRLWGFDPAGAVPWVSQSEDDGSNGWSVYIANKQPGAILGTAYAVAYCAS